MEPVSVQTISLSPRHVRGLDTTLVTNDRGAFGGVIINWDVSEYVQGHLDYEKAVRKFEQFN